MKTQWNVEIPGPKNLLVSLNGGVFCMNGGWDYFSMIVHDEQVILFSSLRGSSWHLIAPRSLGPVGSRFVG